MASNRRGRAQLREYGVWADMLQRCKNPKLRNFYLYGGRGIRVCERWLSFKHFYEDMGARPSKEHSIDRINVDGDYEPGNCRWATRREQNFNKRSNRLVEYGGTSKPLTLWAELYGISPITLNARLTRGWSVAEALTTKPFARGGHR